MQACSQLHSGPGEPFRPFLSGASVAHAVAYEANVPQANFSVSRQREVRRIYLPRARVNRLSEPLLTRYLDSGSYEASGAYEGKTRGRIVR